ncbi:MAG: hypothetical protein IJA72_03045, partial [Clostridia bacterium]|nr:hypothetical protein [Clostridia bacterium]
MISRDFSKSGKEYIKQNKFVLIALAVIIALGVIMLAVFGFNGGSDVKGYNTFSITMGEDYQVSKLGNYTDEIKYALADRNADLQSIQVTGEGDYTTLVVKYSGTAKEVYELNA